MDVAVYHVQRADFHEVLQALPNWQGVPPVDGKRALSQVQQDKTGAFKDAHLCSTRLSTRVHDHQQGPLRHGEQTYFPSRKEAGLIRSRNLHLDSEELARRCQDTLPT